jgi:hypothetical protein
VAGTADQIIDWTGARDFAAAAPNGRARFVPLDGAFHEILNDTGRDVVVRLILAFWQPRAAAAVATTRQSCAAWSPVMMKMMFGRPSPRVWPAAIPASKVSAPTKAPAARSSILLVLYATPSDLPNRTT